MVDALREVIYQVREVDPGFIINGFIFHLAFLIRYLKFFVVALAQAQPRNTVQHFLHSPWMVIQGRFCLHWSAVRIIFIESLNPNRKKGAS